MSVGEPGRRAGGPAVPDDPTVGSGLLAGPSAALNRVQAQRGSRANLSACLDDPPSAAL